MNLLLIYFALPVATIILAIVLEKILKCPILTAATFFAIYLIVTFAAFDALFLVYAIIYTILAFIAAFIAQIVFDKDEEECLCGGKNRTRDSDNNSNNLSNVSNTANNSTCNCNCNETVTANIRNNNTGCQSTWCCHRR